MNKHIVFVITLLVTISSFAQKVTFPTWGKFTEYERNLKTYKIDSTANAVVLNEVGYAYVQTGGEYKIIKEHYYRVKILNKEGASYATLEIPTYKKERIIDVKACTTNFSNGTKTTYIKKSDFFHTQVSENWSQVSFTLPNIEPGSIIEYSYKMVTPYHNNYADGWIFQSDIPKVKSSYYAKIPGYWEYHIASVGIENPKFNQSKLINDCFEVGGSVAQCLFLEYVLEDIPAYIEEDFSTSKNNFLKQLKFELKTIKRTDGTIKHFTKEWEDIDLLMFKQYQIGTDYDKTKFIRKHIPIEIINETDVLERAKKTYSFIKNHFSFNQKRGNPYKFNRKKAFTDKVGNLFEININLINALLAANIQTDFALLSTRKNGFPNKVHPSIADFNYLVAHCKINGKDYFLDATEKKLPFGMLPFHCLNGEFRIFNKKGGSYWYEFKPININETIVYVFGNIKENSTIELKARVVYKGYNAYEKREKINETTLESYKENVDDENEDLSIISHSIENIDDIKKPLIEILEFESESDITSKDLIYFKPFIIKDFETNPFNLEERQYPVDIGYQRKYTYNIVLTIPENKKIKSIPKSRIRALPENGGYLNFTSESKGDKISIRLIFSLDKLRYVPNDYLLIKEIMSQLIIAQNEMIIVTNE